MSSDFLNNEAFNNDNLVNALSRMRQGDVPLRERFTEENKTMIMKVVSQVLGKSAIPTNSKEYDAAITAFNYCIDHYDFNDSESFTTYSEKIIKEWIYHFSWEENSKGMSSVDPASDDSKEYLYRNFENKDEIIIFKQKLWEFGITLRDLFFLGPREVDQIIFSLKVAISIAHSKELYKRMFIIKAIPIDDLEERYKVQKKLIEKNKEYIIALSIILKSDLKVLKSYLINIDQGKPTENIGIILELFKKDAIVMNFSGQFIIIKVDRSNNRSIGKQVQLNKDGSKLYYNKILKFAGIAAGSVAIIMLVVFGSKLFLNKSSDTITPPSSKVIILDDPTPKETAGTTGNIEATETIKVSPTPAVVEQAESPKAASSLDSVNNPEGSETVGSPDSPTATPEQPKKQQATNTKPARPTHTTQKETPRKLITAARPSVKPTLKPSASVEVPKIAGAKGVPETVQISSDTYSVKVGDHFSLSMNMPGGNNGSTLILYENNEVISSTPIADNTPYPQSRTVAIIAERRGIFNYKWKLVNDFGSSSSGTLTMIVTD
jgi:RNA polymerase sigma-I factor